MLSCGTVATEQTQADAALLWQRAIAGRLICKDLQSLEGRTRAAVLRLNRRPFLMSSAVESLTKDLSLSVFCFPVLQLHHIGATASNLSGNR